MKNTACMNKTSKEGYYVLTRQYVPSGEYHLEPVWIEDTMTKKCRSDMDIWRTGACRGCKIPQDFDYFRAQGWV